MAVQINQKVGKASSGIKKCFSSARVCQAKALGETHGDMAMIIERKEAWGKLVYDTSKHRFSLHHTDGKTATPYVKQPVVLNAYLTMKCNMNCMHCVTKDFDRQEDLAVSTEVVNWINRSPFMIVVITGGEPLLPEYEDQLMRVLQRTHNKGLVIDTNGTILPSHSVIDTILNSSALVRISWDTTHPKGEMYFRHAKPLAEGNYQENYEWYKKKRDMIQRFRSQGVDVAVQSVVHKKNLESIRRLPEVLHEFSINQWYIQRFIPAHRAIRKTLEVSSVEYEQIIERLTEICNGMKIECITKKDRRHNCVFMLVGDGRLYTQGEKPGQKIQIGTTDSDIRYFEYVSSADHAERYYG
jgi:molybdenum cofactor biosynthesis enzyme MoaA